MKKFCFLLFMLNGLAYANNLDQAKSDCENETDPEKKAVFCSVYQQMLQHEKINNLYDKSKNNKTK